MVMGYKEFFEKYGQMETPTIEETYQAFKARLKDETEIFMDRIADKDDKDEWSEHISDSTDNTTIEDKD